MVNPLARVVMNNVTKKANAGNVIGSKDKVNRLNFTKLDAVASTMKKNDKVKEINFTNKRGSEEKVNNLTLEEQDLIVDVIKGERKVREGKDVATMITLDEAVERIKGSR